MTHEEMTRRFYAHVWPQRALVLRSAMLLCRRADEAEDLAQETLLKAFRAILSFDPSTNVQAWLMTILRHAHIDRIRSATRGPAPISVEDLGEEVEDRRSPGEHAESHDLETLLERLSDAQVIAGLRRLPEEICWSLLLVDVQQMAYGEAAGVLEVPEGTVKSRVHRGRRMLREELMRLRKQAAGASISGNDGGSMP